MIAGSPGVFEPGHPRRYHRPRGLRSVNRSRIRPEPFTTSSRRSQLGAHPTRKARRLGRRRARAGRGRRHRPCPHGSCARGDPGGCGQRDRQVARAGATFHVSVDGHARAARRGPAPPRVGRQGREHAGRVPARRAPERRRRLRRARGGRHHPFHGAVPVQGRQAGRARPERADHGPEGVDPVRPALGDRLLGWPARRRQRGETFGAHQLRRGFRRRRVLARRRAVRAA